MARIIHICNKGDETRTLRQCEYLALHGHEVIVIIGSQIFPHEDPLVFRDTYSGMRRFTINHRVLERSLFNALAAMNPDILHIHEYPLAFALLQVWNDRGMHSLAEGKGSYQLRDHGVFTRKAPCKIVVDWHEYEYDRPIGYAHRDDWEEIRRQTMMARQSVDGEVFVASEFAARTYAGFGDVSATQRALDQVIAPGCDRKLPWAVVYNAGPRPAEFRHIDPGMLQIRPPTPGKKRILYPGNASRERRIVFMSLALDNCGLSTQWEMACATKPGMFRAGEWPLNTVQLPFTPWPSFARPAPEFYAMHAAAPDAVYVGGDVRYDTWKYAWPNKFSDAVFSGVPVISADMIPISNRLSEFTSLGVTFRDLDELKSRLAQFAANPIKQKEEERKEFIERYCFERSSGPALLALYDRLGFRTNVKLMEPASPEGMVFVDAV